MRKRIRDYIKQFFLIDDTPHKIAAGAALGVFFGIVPGEGFGTTLLFSYLLRLNRLAALAGVSIVNTWTTVLVLPFAAIAGAFVLGVNKTEIIHRFNGLNGNYFQLFLNKVFFREITLPLLVGFFIVAGTVALLIYLLLLLVLNFRKTRKNVHLLHTEDSGD